MWLKTHCRVYNAADCIETTSTACYNTHNFHRIPHLTLDVCSNLPANTMNRTLRNRKTGLAVLQTHHSRGMHPTWLVTSHLLPTLRARFLNFQTTEPPLAPRNTLSTSYSRKPEREDRATTATWRKKRSSECLLQRMRRHTTHVTRQNGRTRCDWFVEKQEEPRKETRFVRKKDTSPTIKDERKGKSE